MSSLEYTDLRSMTRAELEEVMTQLGAPKYRAGQVFSQLHAHPVRDIADMTLLPSSLREELSAHYLVSSPVIETRQVSAIDGTEKYLYRMRDGEYIESVLMRYRYGNSVCISSQAGCRMGCSFCASTIGELTRNLLPGEMLAQVYGIAEATGERVSHVVVMGTGEPLDNYDNLLRFIRLISDENGMNLSRRNITVSTCGLVPQMRRLAEEDLPITLALSLHAPNDEKRRSIMPVARRYDIASLMDACRYYYEKTGRRITFEYSLIRGVNDLEEDARELSALARDVKAHINLIPVNPVRETGYEESAAPRIEAFKTRLEKSGVNVSIRRVLGRDIDGACGQLRHKYGKEKIQENG